LFSFSRNSRSRLANWWWTVDKVLLGLITTLILIGVFLNFSASPAVANRIGLGSFHFVKRQLFFLPIAYILMLFLSMQNLKNIRRIAIFGYIIAMGFTLATIFLGVEIKGATRWVRIFGFSLQPSEFIKPFFAVVAAWLFDSQKKFSDFPGNLISTMLFGLTLVFLFLQPDIGMSVLIGVIWGFQFFLAGLSVLLVGAMAGIVAILGIFAYFTFSHVQIRIQQFLTSGQELSFQIRKSLEAFQSGNIFGRGPGEGVVKQNIPDAHTDFIFAVAGEEFGIILCLIIVGLFASIVVRSMFLSLKDNNLFVILSASALAASFGLQGIINMASTLHLMPTKGMTLPFISYGGSSLLSAAIGIGMLLAITRKNVSAEDKDDF
jgi:cell division protein FtsW